ncbi:MAG TPA: hypothetical protein VJN21_00885 [Candidatus Acidoferrales bacterium]|nr:hypothetical protein [Candidatus Acidoferrales bacterium]
MALLNRVVPGSALPGALSRTSIWNLASLAGRLVELSGGARAAHLTAAFGLVLDAQLGADGAAWVTLERSSFFPPDVVDSGVDIDALPVVRVPNVRMAWRAAEHLVRSGGFGLVVIDLSDEIGTKSGPRPSENGLSASLLARLLGLARQQNVAVLFLTKKSQEAPSLHSLISLRAAAEWRRQGEQYEVSVRVLKDKYCGERRAYREMCRGPAGLR